MLIKNITTSNQSYVLTDTDNLIRHIMDHQYDWSVGSPAERAFQRSSLNGKGLSVSIEALLTPAIRKAVIRSLEKIFIHINVTQKQI